MTDITELTGVTKHSNQHRLSRLIIEAPNDELRQLAVEVEQYTDQLIEALEKAQQQTTESENRVRKQNRHICELFDDNTALCQRIAELESRTVKLPQRLQPGADGYDDWYVHSDDDGEYLKFDDVLAMLTAAGIKVEAE
ncbi:hypothetical protein ACPZ8P_06445 [Klebsiella pneumoniae subsp. pneumoniae]